MKRLLLMSLILVAVIAAFVLVAVAWLAGTADGTRRLMAAVSRLTPLKISARTVDGRLLDRLRLEGVSFTLDRQRGEVDRVVLSWQPWRLFAGEVHLRELVLSGVRVVDHAPKVRKPPQFTWPRVPLSREFLQVTADRFAIDGLSYGPPGEEPLRLNHASASLGWKDGLLTVRGLTAVTASGRITGNLLAGFRRPALESELSIVLPEPVEGIRRLSVVTLLREGRRPEQLSGTVSLEAHSATRKLHSLTGTIGLTRTSVNIQRLLVASSGRKGKITGSGTLLFAAQEPLATLDLKVSGLDLSPELHQVTDLSGDIVFVGSRAGYRGHLDLTNRGKGWRAGRLVALYRGNDRGVTLSSVSGSLLRGNIAAELEVDWSDGVRVAGTAAGSNLDPAVLSPEWHGVINFSAEGNVAWSEQKGVRAAVTGELLESRLHGRVLTGSVKGAVAGDDLFLDRLDLHGSGFDLAASGDLRERIGFTIRATDLSLLVPETSGAISGEGWLRLANGKVSGAVAASGANLAAAGARAGILELGGSIGGERDPHVQFTARLGSVAVGGLAADSVVIGADGTASRHTASLDLARAEAVMALGLSGGYGKGRWRGEIIRMSGKDAIGPWELAAPARLAVSREEVSLSPLTLIGNDPETAEISLDLQPLSRLGIVRAKWRELDFRRANGWLKDMTLDGATNGELDLRLLSEGRVEVTGKADGFGTVTAGGGSLTVERLFLDLQGGASGMRAEIAAKLAEGEVTGKLTSPRPLTLNLPEEGNLALATSRLELAGLMPWLPAGTELKGRLDGRITGRMLPGQRFRLTGEAELAAGSVRVRRPEGEVNLNLRSASAEWDWRDETLAGDLVVEPAGYGEVEGEFELPLPARLPTAFDPDGPVRARVSGEMRELGVLGAVLPGLLQETRGVMEVDLGVTGSWRDPQLTGRGRLTEAGAYLPGAGITVRDVALEAGLENNRVTIEAFRARSGPGTIEGTGEVVLREMQVATFSGSLRGERFQVVHLPELQAQTSLELTFEGNPEKVAVRGEVRLPELLVYGAPSANVVTASEDVVIERSAPPAAASRAIDLDVRVRLILGDRVVVKAEGIDARLGGELTLAMTSLDHVTSMGEIKVVKGRYHTYGVALDIVRGRLFYGGGPVDEPTLDILALRTVGDVKAGVTIAGSARAPVVKLYSEPPMPDVDILAYVVLGHPLGESGEQVTLLARAADAMLSAGDSVSLQDKIRNRLGLSTLEIETATGQPSGLMGYKEIEITPPGQAPTRQQTGISQTLVTVGKYLAPGLYISYGRSLFTGSNLFRLRYDIARNWQIQTETGTESGADLYYKIDFD